MAEGQMLPNSGFQSLCANLFTPEFFDLLEKGQSWDPQWVACSLFLTCHTVLFADIQVLQPISGNIPAFTPCGPYKTGSWVFWFPVNKHGKLILDRCTCKETIGIREAAFHYGTLSSWEKKVEIMCKCLSWQKIYIFFSVNEYNFNRKIGRILHFGRLLVLSIPY